MHLVILQALHTLVRVLATVHHDKCAPTWRNQVDANNVTVLAERVGQLLLLNQLGQVANPQSGTANTEMVLLDLRQSTLLAFPLTLLIALLVLLAGAIPIAVP